MRIGIDSQAQISACGLQESIFQHYPAAMGVLADNIKALRSRYENQTVFGDELGVSQSTIARWERGSKPEVQHLQALAALANTSVDRFVSVPLAEILTLNDDPMPNVDELTSMLDIVFGTLPWDLPREESPRRAAQGLHILMSRLQADRAGFLKEAETRKRGQGAASLSETAPQDRA